MLISGDGKGIQGSRAPQADSRKGAAVCETEGNECGKQAGGDRWGVQQACTHAVTILQQECSLHYTSTWYTMCIGEPPCVSLEALS